MKENTAEQQISVERGINQRDGIGVPHHLGHMLDQTSPPRMVEEPGRSRPLKTRSKLFQKSLPERFKARFLYPCDKRNNELKVFLN